MKRTILFLLLLTLIVACCNHNPKSLNEVSTQAYSLVDSVYHENEYDSGYAYFAMNLDIPVTENETLRQSITSWMLSSDTDDPMTYLLSMRNNFFLDEGDEPMSAYEENCTLSEQTDRYVTYINEGYIYAGGAHEIPWYNGTTFSKIDGSIVGYDLFDDPELLINLIAENIEEQYFSRLDEEDFSPEYEEITSLPANEPWIETDSVVFCYMPYEIAAYSMGMPLCKISKEELWPYLSDKGKAFFQP